MPSPHSAPPSAPIPTVSAERPGGWLDKTMTVYSAPPDPAREMAPNIVISRDHLAAGETFREYCNRQIEAFRGSLPQFVRESEGHGQVHARDAFQVQLTWTSAAGTLRQRVFFVDAGGGVIVNYAASAAAEDFAAHEPQFERGLATLRIEPGQADGAGR